MLQAYRFALDPTAAQQRALASHCGAARKAFNESLAQVKRCLDQRDAERSYGVPDGLLTEVPWSLPALRRWWNQVKDERAPWWRENSKEAYNSGLDALARGLKAWSDSRSGKRRGPKIAFPKFRGRHRARPSCRFSTGAIRVDDRSHVVLPRIGRIKTHEPTTALLGKVTAGQARVLAVTVSFDGRRWYCSFTVEAERELRPPAHAGPGRLHPVVGVDLGVRDLLVAAAPDSTEVARIPAPKPLTRVQARLRAVQRKAARQAGPDRRSSQRPSMRWTKTAARIGRIHARAANIRRDALHKATTQLAQRHQVIVVEDLAVAHLTHRKPGAGKGGRGLNRVLADAAPAELRRQLGYKTSWYGSALLVADRWYPSSKMAVFGWAMLRYRDPVRAQARIGRMALAARTGPEAGRRPVIAARVPAEEWPDRRLLITAVDAMTGEFTVFDAARGVSLVDAVGASCAVPGVWPPVTMARRRWIDGGVRSPANADLAAECDRIVVLAPIPRGLRAATAVAGQAAGLTRAGRKVAVVSPDKAAVAAIGRNVLDPARRAPAARAGHTQAGAAADRVGTVWNS